MLARPLLPQNPKQAPSHSEFVISDRGYGKDFVKLLHVKRDGETHHIREFEVGTHLKLASDVDYLKVIKYTDIFSEKNILILDILSRLKE